ANRFLTTKAGANLRALLHADLTPVEIYDLGDTRPFQAAVLPAVTIAVRGRRDRECRFVSAYEVPAGPATETDLYDALTAAEDSIVGHGGRCIAVEVGTLSSARGRPDQDAGSGFDPAIPWRISRPATDTWLERLGARTWRTFGEVARIRVGIKTTADRVFISDDWEDLPRPPEPELLLDLLTHHDIAPWRIERAQHTRVLYPYRRDRSRRITVDLREYPCAAAYLEEYRELLTARDYLVGSGREWFEIWVPQRPDLWSEPKVVFPDISVAPRFALDRSGAVVNGDCYWMSLADIGCEQIAYLLMGVANSTLGTRFYDAVCGNRLYAGRRRWITQYVARLPIPDPGTAAAGKLAALAGEFATGSAEPDLAALDELVAAAFGISPPSE
ncbi:MAG: DNA methyltransferase, partial [Nocardia sp.]|nr:DNA methyltransferase [Nocardia sp.]